MRIGQQRVDLSYGAFLVSSGLPNPTEARSECVYCSQLGIVVVTPSGPSEVVQVLIQGNLVIKLLTAIAVGVDQHRRSLQRPFGVMTEKHLTNDPFAG